MKKGNLAISTLAFALVLGGCSAIANNSLTSVGSQDTQENLAVEDVDSIYGLSAVSSVSLLSQLQKTEASTLSFGGMRPRDVSEEDITKINNYLGLFENLLADGKALDTSVVTSDKEGYDYMMVVSTQDLLGVTSSYTMYYNEVIIEEVPEEPVEEPITSEPVTSEPITSEPVSSEPITSEPVTSEPVSSDTTSSDSISSEVVNEVDVQEDLFDREVRIREKFDRELDNENEVSTQLEGIMIIGDVEYTVEGRKVVTTVEGKSKVKTTFISKTDSRNLVKVTQDTQEEEGETKQRFQYTVIKDGRLVSFSNIVLSTGTDRDVIKMMLIEDGQFSNYEFKKIEEEGKQIIMIRVIDATEILNIKVFVNVDEVTGETTYQYRLKDGKEFFHGRHMYGNREDQKN